MKIVTGKQIWLVKILVAMLLISGQGLAQCYEDFIVEKSWPVGDMCKAGGITLRATYNGSASTGMFLWYTSEWATTPEYTQIVEPYWGNVISEYGFYASYGSVMWVSFYNDQTLCESYRVPYYISFENPPAVSQNYARECGDGVVRLQLNSNKPNVVFQLYRLSNGSYNLEQSNSSGYFEISSFNPAYQNSYYYRVYQPGGCTNETYYQLSISIAHLNVPSVSGNTLVCVGNSTGLTANGNSDYYRWYDGSGNEIYQGTGYTVPAGLAPANYTYQVRGFSNGGCSSGTGYVNVSVNPKPVDGTISASAASIVLGQSVTITSQGGTGTPYYWCSNNGGTTWDIFSAAFGGLYSFSHTPSAAGTYRYHLRNATPACGFCWDASGGGCSAYAYVDVTVLPPPLLPGSISYNGGPINNGTVPVTVSGTPATQGNCNGNYNYQWQYSTTGAAGPFYDIAGANSESYNPGALTTTTHYRRRVICASETQYSNIVEVAVYPALQPGTITPATQTVYYNTNASALSLTGVTGGNGSYSYQWQSSPNFFFNNPVTITGATGASYTPTAVTNKTYYRVIVASNGVTKNSGIAIVYVLPPLQEGTIAPAAYTIASGTAPGKLAAGSATGGNCSGNYTYQWQQCSDGVSFSDIPGATALSYEPGSLTATVYYRRKANCGNETAYSNICKITIETIDAENQNYIRSREYTRAGIADEQTAIDIADINEAKQTTDYFDGLGRLMQTVVKQGSKTGSAYTDLVMPALYDVIGREAAKYLPYAASSDNGYFKTRALGEQTDFYKVQNPEESVYYEQTQFEPSALNRINKTTPAGDNWTGSNRGTETKYWTNTNIDQVQIWKTVAPAIPGDWGTYANAGVYDYGALFKNVTIDEHGKQVIEFKNKEGLVVLKKVQLTAAKDDGDGKDHSGWLCTYYIYDHFNKLRAVLQPKAVEYLDAHAWAFDAAGTVLKELCFRFEYDEKRRMIAKQTPGNGAIYTVYDARDRVVMTQDANLRNLPVPKWQFTVYDELNRPVKTGLLESSDSRASHQGPAGNSTQYPNINSYVNEVLTETHYDDYANLPAGLASGLVNSGYTNYIQTSYNASPEFAQPVTQSLQTIGLITWQKARVLGTADMLATVNIYDAQGRVIQTQSINQTGAVDVTTMQYNFSGNVLRLHVNQQKGGTTPVTISLATKNVYDALGRVTSIEKNLNNTGWKVISQQSYDAFGKEKNKKLGNKSGTTTALVELDYRYSIRGWLTSINKDYFVNGGADRYFGMQLGYDRHNVNPAFNGNVAGVSWKSAGDQEQRKYDFSYDAANRLMKADFADNKGYDFDVVMGNGINPVTAYDANGNIKAMTQKGIKGANTAFTIDQLTYNYLHTGNDLTNKVWEINDAAPATSTLGDFNDKNNNTSDDYDFDANGNLVFDKNRKVSSITYNHLNLPVVVTMLNDNGTNKGTITYTYDANGNKLKKVVVDNTASPAKTTTTLYMNGIVYQDDVVSFINHEEGRIRFEKATQATCPPGVDHFVFDYFIKDNLGNIRTVLTEDATVDCYQVLSVDGDATDISLQNNQWEKADGTAMNVTAVRQAWPSSFKLQYGGTASDPNGEYGYPVKKSSGAVGAGKLIKVMAGDHIHTSVEYYYETTGSNTNANGLNTMVTSLLGALNGSPAAGIFKGEGSAITNVLGSNTDVLNFFSPQSGGGGAEPPKAYLNILVFDDQFKFDNTQSMSIRVGSTANEKGLIDKRFSNALAIQKSGYVYVYFSNESDQQVFFDNFYLSQEHGPLMEETHYYPFGLTMAGISSRALKPNYVENKFRFTGKELQSKEFSDGSGLEWTDFGARMYDHQIGRWQATDGKADLYLATSPYVYALNQPTNAVDPDGNLVIFIQGNHFGERGHEYWTAKDYYKLNLGRDSKTPPGYHLFTWGTDGGAIFTKDRYFDYEVMDQLNDHHNPRYYDGSAGGWFPLFYWRLAGTAAGRREIGYNQGKRDAAKIIAQLERDKTNGNIIETIKIVTHSMGGAFAKGFIQALREYIATLPAEVQQQIRISFVADFDPYEGRDLTADGITPTFQFIHYGTLANQKEKGKVQQMTSNSTSKKHSIFSFFKDISQLKEGSYTWNEKTQQWDFQGK